jgi:hypothetical protein
MLRGERMKRLLMLVIMTILVLATASTVFATKDFNNLKPCPLSTDQYSYAYNKKTGYTTYSYFDKDYNYLGMEQFDAYRNLIIDTYTGTCGAY